MSSTFAKTFWAPLAFISFFFAGQTETTLKAGLMCLAVLLLDRSNSRTYFDRNFFALAIFFAIYNGLVSLGSYPDAEVHYSLLAMPAALYASGKWLGRKLRSGNEACMALLLIGALVASGSLVAIFRDIEAGGFEGGIRVISLGPEMSDISATVIAGRLVMLVSLGGALLIADAQTKLRWRLTILALFVASLLAGARLGSRTTMVVAVASLAVAAAVNITRASFIRTLLIAAVLTIVTYVALQSAIGNIDLFAYYRDRLNSDEFGATTAGGRVQRWTDALVMISDYPFGWSIRGLDYAHNLWLDIARGGGWLSLLLSILITAGAFRSIRRSVKRNRQDSAFVTTILCLAVGFFLLFMTEPILDGFDYVFAAFCCYWGMAVGFKPAQSYVQTLLRASPIGGKIAKHD